MNNKGFTLIELIATIALLAVISVISFVSINGVIKKSKINDCKNLVSSIRSATKEYVSDNRYKFDDNNDKEINASVLVNGNYLSGSIVNPFNNENINPDDINIYITLRDDYTVNTIEVKNKSNVLIDCDSEEW